MKTIVLISESYIEIVIARIVMWHEDGPGQTRIVVDDGSDEGSICLSAESPQRFSARFHGGE